MLGNFHDKGWWHSFDLPDGRHIDGFCTVEGLRKRIEQFPIPADLRGARVLDIGAWDGWYSFEMERRGAEVLAIDCWDNLRFRQVHAALKSKVEYRQMDVYALTPDSVGRFDIVLFMGVLYHLKHPLLGLERVCAITKDLAAVDSFILREEHRPGENVENRAVMEFYETNEFAGQTDNWCGPSLPCLMAMCRTAGFARVEHRATLPDGACIACYRRWKPAERAVGDRPQLLAAVHNLNYGINFQSRLDEYLFISLRWPGDSLSVDQVEPQVGEFGVRPVYLWRSTSDTWHANFKLPPGLTSGWHDVIVSVCGASSNSTRIAIDMAPTVSGISICGLSDGTTWVPGVLDLTKGNILTAWVTGLPENADRANVSVLFGGERLAAAFVSPANGNETRQVNIPIPDGVPAEDMELKILIGESQSPPAVVRIVR